MDRPEIVEKNGRDPGAEMASARDPRRDARPGSAFARLRPARGGPVTPLPEGCFGLVDHEDGGGPAGWRVRRGRPHVFTNLRREGWYPPKGPHHVPQRPWWSSTRPANERVPRHRRPVAALKRYYNQMSAALGRSKRRCWKPAGSPYVEACEVTSRRRTARGGAAGPEVTTRVDCGEFFPVRDDALRAHETQVDTDGFCVQVRWSCRRAFADLGVEMARSFRRHSMRRTTCSPGAGTAAASRTEARPC